MKHRDIVGMQLTIAAMLVCLGVASTSAKESAVSDSPAAGFGSLSGIWVNSSYETSSRSTPRDGLIKASDGTSPPLQPWARELVDKRVKETEEGRPYATTKSHCLPAGVPQMMFGPKLPIQILETPGQITILIEEFNNFRIIRMNKNHREDPDPTFMGDSIGHWEGDTLVIDTIGLTDKTTLDPIATPHSDALHVVERIRRTGQDTLEVVVEFDDPRTFTKPWTAKTSFKAASDWDIQESLCENNRNQPRDGVVTMQMPSTNE